MTQENRSLGFPTRSDINQRVPLQNKARSLKFQIWEEDLLYYPGSKNKGADQLYTYCTTDLCLCFSIDKNPVFSWRSSNETSLL